MAMMDESFLHYLTTGEEIPEIELQAQDNPDQWN